MYKSPQYIFVKSLGFMPCIYLNTVGVRLIQTGKESWPFLYTAQQKLPVHWGGCSPHLRAAVSAHELCKDRQALNWRYHPQRMCMCNINI